MGMEELTEKMKSLEISEAKSATSLLMEHAKSPTFLSPSPSLSPTPDPDPAAKTT